MHERPMVCERSKGGREVVDPSVRLFIIPAVLNVDLAFSRCTRKSMTGTSSHSIAHM